MTHSRAPAHLAGPDEVNLGSVQRAEALDFAVPIRNDGDEHLEVSVGQKSCGCVVVADPNPEGKPVTIPPRGSHVFRLRVRLQAAPALAVRQTVTFVTQYGQAHKVVLGADLSGRLTSRPGTVSEILHPGESRSVALDIIYNGEPRPVRLEQPTSSDPTVVRIASTTEKSSPVDPVRPAAGTIVATLHLDFPPLPVGENLAQVTVPLGDEPGTLAVAVRRRQETDLQVYPKSLTFPRVENGQKGYQGRLMLTWRDGKRFRLDVKKPPEGITVNSDPGERQTHILSVSGDGRGLSDELVVTAIDEKGAHETIAIPVRSLPQTP